MDDRIFLNFGLNKDNIKDKQRQAIISNKTAWLRIFRLQNILTNSSSNKRSMVIGDIDNSSFK